jgi:hypothetical protein
LLGLEILKGPEIQIYLELTSFRIVAELVIDGERCVRTHALEDAIEIVGSYFDEPALLQTRQRFNRLTAQIRKDTHNKGKFLYFNGITDFDVVSYVDPRRTNTF